MSKWLLSRRTEERRGQRGEQADVQIALLGAGRTAKVRVESIVGHARTEVAYVVDVGRAPAESIDGPHGARA